MPNRIEIEQQINQVKAAAQDMVRYEYLTKIREHTGNDVIVYAANPNPGRYVGSLTSIDTWDIQGFMTTLHGMKGESLDLILHSNGGTLEGAEQIVNYLRAKYKKIRAIIPQNAMSAATMLACACDEIIMGKQSAIGPTDPQMFFRTPSGMAGAPAQALLDDFEQAKVDVGSNPNLAPLWVSKIQDYPPGIFTICKNLIEVAQERVRNWLAKYMFKDEQDAERKAMEIAQWLNSHSTHKTHGHPISYYEAKEHGLKVTLLENDQHLQDMVLSLFHALVVTFDVTDIVKIIEGHNQQRWFIFAPKG